MTQDQALKVQMIVQKIHEKKNSGGYKDGVSAGTKVPNKSLNDAAHRTAWTRFLRATYKDEVNGFMPTKSGEKPFGLQYFVLTVVSLSGPDTASIKKKIAMTIFMYLFDGQTCLEYYDENSKGERTGRRKAIDLPPNCDGDKFVGFLYVLIISL